tara:strand:+ start:79 stop:276 length:198 start_codon:yes stop_codon:yes gene_type:complete
MIKGLFGSYNDPRDEKDEVEHYCKNCGMEEVEEKGNICDECYETYYCKCGLKLIDNHPMCNICKE